MALTSYGQNITQNVETLMAALDQHIREQLEGFAVHAEDTTRSESENYWQDDSGSARDSITAYSVGIGDPQKNYSSSNWSEARTPGYRSPRWANPETNFQPDDGNEADIDMSEPAVILTMYVPYAPALEFGINNVSTLSVGGLIQKMSANLEDEFQKAFTQAVASALG